MKPEIKRNIKQIMERIDELEHRETEISKMLCYCDAEETLNLKQMVSIIQGELESLYWIIGGKPLPF